MYFQYIYRHVSRCERTLGQYGARHDINASVNSIHEFYVDIFILQVSNITGCKKCSIKNVEKIYQIYYRICDLNGNWYIRHVHHLFLD